jgi:methionyl-tRNA formyltransferase
MDEGLDTGPVFSRHVIELSETENAGTLADRIATLGAHVVQTDLASAVDGSLTAEAQDATLASHAPLIERHHLSVDWGRPALDIARLVRGMSPRPGAFTVVAGKTLRILDARPASGPMPSGAPPGTVSVLGKRALVATGSGTLELLIAQAEGKKPLAAVDLINGRVLAEGLLLGT